METRDDYGPGRPGRARMETDRTPLTVLLLLAVVAAAQFVHYYDLLPPTLATHFGTNGAPNGWTGKAGFVASMAIIEALFIVGAFIFARFAGRIPAGALNIPNRDYWLEPERRDDTLRFVWGQILWIEAVTVAFLIAVTEMVFRANMTDVTPSLSNNFFYVMAVFMILVGWMSVRIFVRFRREDRG